MKKWITVIWVILLIAVALYAAVYFWIVPFGAKLTLPFKWNNIPLHEKRVIVESYLGRPANSADWQVKAEKWISRRDNYAYTLQISYSKDSTADHYTIAYEFRNGFFKRTGTLVSK